MTDQGLKILSPLPKLEELYLESAAVTDIGLAELHRMKTLKRVTLLKTKVTKSGIDALRKALPDASVTQE